MQPLLRSKREATVAVVVPRLVVTVVVEAILGAASSHLKVHVYRFSVNPVDSEVIKDPLVPAVIFTIVVGQVSIENYLRDLP